MRHLLLLSLLALLGSCATTGLRDLAFVTTRDGNHEIYVRAGTDGSFRNLTHHPKLDRQPAWSPDGTRIAFTSTRTGNNEVFIMASDGSNVVNVTRHPGNDGQPAWSPDGRRLAFVSDRDHESREIYLMNADGSDVQRLTNNTVYEESPEWSPDGECLVFARMVGGAKGKGDGEIFIHDLATATDRRITQRPGFDGAPSWSPDGRHIAFHGSVGETFDIFRVEVDGSNLENITQDAIECYQPGWTDDGTRLVYCAGTGPHDYDIWVMNADGSARRQLTNHSDRDEAPTVRPR